jgi:hypothetical protein
MLQSTPSTASHTYSYIAYQMPPNPADLQGSQQRVRFAETVPPRQETARARHRSTFRRVARAVRQEVRRGFGHVVDEMMQDLRRGREYFVRYGEAVQWASAHVPRQEMFAVGNVRRVRTALVVINAQPSQESWALGIPSH